MLNDAAESPLFYGSVWKRFLAALIDLLIVAVIAGMIILLASDDVWLSILIIFLAIVVGQWLYFAVMESSRGATVGKNLMELGVVDMEGQPISFARATGRYFAKMLSSILLIGYFMAFFTKKRQALHDILAGTLVIDKEFASLIAGSEARDNPEMQPLPLELTTTPDKTPVDPSLEKFGSIEKPSPQSPVTPPDPDQNTVAQGATLCPKCDSPVGKFQTKCHRCGTALKKGMF
ncbi:MAG: RDD family protein [Bacteroidota bacterium]